MCKFSFFYNIVSEYHPLQSQKCHYNGLQFVSCVILTVMCDVVILVMCDMYCVLQYVSIDFFIVYLVIPTLVSKSCDSRLPILL